MDLFFERRYEHPIERVWEAISTSTALERWLMRNDFKAELGRACVFRFCTSDNPEDTLVFVTVEGLDPPRFMKWRWREEDEVDSVVTFELESIGSATLLRVRHSGDVSAAFADSLERGWPGKLDALDQELSS